LAESSVTRFFQGSLDEQWRLRAAAFLSDVRVFKLIRWIAKGVFDIGPSFYPNQFHREMLGYPAFCFPLDPKTAQVVNRHQSAFVEAWRDDMRFIIQVAQG
jgi:hypothetical protein